MADNVTTQTTALATIPDATKVATDQLAGGEHVQYVKLMDGTADGSTKATVNATGLKVDASGAAVPVTDNAGSLTVDAPVATPVATRLSDGAAFIDPRDVSDRSARLVGVVSGAANVFHVDDNAGSLTVDAPVGTPVFVRLSDGTVALVGQKVMAGSLPVVIASDQTVVPVSDNAGSLTVDAPVGTPAFVRLSDGAAALIGQKAMAASVPVVLASDQTTLPAVSEQRAATLHVTGTAAVNTGVTVSLPIPGAGLFHYITSIQIVKLYAVVGVASAAGVIITSTNLPGNPAWTTEQLASVAGTAPTVLDYKPTTPLKSAVANTATTIVCPVQLQTIWRVNVSYFTAV